MIKWILHLQQKPEGYRKKVAFLLSLLFTSIVLLIWLVAVITTPSNSNELTISEDEIVNPLGSLRSSFSSASHSLEELFYGFTEEF